MSDVQTPDHFGWALEKVCAGGSWSCLWNWLEELPSVTCAQVTPRRAETRWYQRQLSFPDSVHAFCICRLSDSDLYCKHLQSTNQLRGKYSWKSRISMCHTLATVDSFGL